jgi:hypothetical protein
VNDAAVRAWVEASCRRQGVPLFVTDPVVLGRVFVLLLAGSAIRYGRLRWVWFISADRGY